MRSNSESGQTILIVALALVVLILVAALAIDIGYMRYQRRLVQMAADSAAIAGAAQYNTSACNRTLASCPAMILEGQTNASYNGFTNDTTNTPPQTTVLIQSPPQGGRYPGSTNYVEAVITHNVPMFFVKALGSSFASFPVTARAVAYPGPGPSCIYALQGGIEFGGGTTQLQAPACILNDSGNLCLESDSYLLDTMGSAVAGSYDSAAAGCVASSSQYGTVTPPPVSSAPVIDPLAYLSNNPPTIPSCMGQSTSYVPGVFTYPCGLSITGTTQLQGGLYIVGGGMVNGLQISGSGQVTATGGVTFYTGANGVSINNGTDYGNQNCPGAQNIGMTVELSAPTDPGAPYPGILFMEDGTQPSTITLNNGDPCGNLGSTQPSYLWGVMHFPSAQLTLNGTGGGPACSTVPRFTIVIAQTLIPEGNVNFGVADCSRPFTPYFGPLPLTPPLPDPIKDAVLVE